MRIFPLSESAITIELGNEISAHLNARAIALAEHFSDNRFPGFVEAVSAYASVTLFFDPAKTSTSAVQEIAARVAGSISEQARSELRLVTIPMQISEESSPDLISISECSGLRRNDVIEIFLSRTYRVYMLGFLPGFAYMGEVDDRIATPRLGTPRTSVAKGSIGIAGKQAGIYPLDSPGGWNIIGRTDARMFDPDRAEPCLLQPGDEVRFETI